jgi:ADP-L-glycero-D-manno-heptose 6-epimerase
MIIVTGGSGFIGSALVWRLNQLGRDDIIVVDHFGENDKYKNIIPLRFQDVFGKDDFGNMVANDFLKKFKIETIYHLGACSATTELDMEYLLQNNYEYSKFLCQNAVENNIRFVYASSAATYGDGSKGYSDDETKLESLRPLNPYGYSKHLFDLWVKHNKLLDKVAGLKYFNVYGPNEYHKNDMRSVVNKCFYQIKETGKARLFKSSSKEFGDGEQKRDFIYVKDVVDMTLFFGENKDVNGIYNVGTGEANSFNSFIKPIFSALGLKENIEYFDMPEILKNKYQNFTEADMNKLRKAGYKNEMIAIDDAVFDYVKNYLNTENKYLS